MWSDFIGFTFDGVRSDELNILRVSDGDRYNEEILPELEDLTVEVNNRDGVYYFGSFYKSRQITINIAFDSVTEEQYRNIRRLFGQKKICDLIFDERPYKVYRAKVSEPIQLETICFDEPYREPGPERDGVRVVERTSREVPTGAAAIAGMATVGTAEVGNDNPDETVIKTEIVRERVTPWVVDHNRKRRIYKGEGEITFTVYDPFARQLYKTLDQYAVNGYDNVDEWAASSGIVSAEEYEAEAYDVYRDISDDGVHYAERYNGAFNVYNPGDIDSPYTLFIPYVNNKIDPQSGDNIIISTDGAIDLIIEPFEKEGNDSRENGIIIDTRAELIQGVQYDYTLKAWRTTGTIYNRHILEGKFGKIYKGNKFDFRKQGVYLNCLVKDNKPAIFYNYLYY